LALRILIVLNPALESHAMIARPAAWMRAGIRPDALPLGVATLFMASEPF